MHDKLTHATTKMKRNKSIRFITNSSKVLPDPLSLATQNTKVHDNSNRVLHTLEQLMLTVKVEQI